MALVGPEYSEARLCGCEGLQQHYRLDEQLARFQQVSDLFIFLSYFSIPAELLYFLARSKLVFPFKWIILQFGLFIVLCGLTHLVAMWTYHEHTYGIALTQTVMKALTALVSCATALTLVYVIPELCSLKVREVYLRSKAEELDREIGVVRTAEEAGRNVRMLTSEIRSTLDRDTILKTTLVELGKTLQLWNCMLWMVKPGSQSSKLTLAHQLKEDRGKRPSVPVQDPIVQSIFSVNTAILISSTSRLAVGDDQRVPADGSVVAIRVPLLHEISGTSSGLEMLVESALESTGALEVEEPGEADASRRSSDIGGVAEYAVLVLVLPGGSARRWRSHELEIVESVADQVAVALSHASILEESKRVRDQLIEQNKALVIARQEAETAIRARNDFLAVMNHEMRTPMHAIIALTSLLREDASLSQDQKLMVDTIVKSSALLSTLINDILDFSRLEDGRLGLDVTTFDLQSLLREAENLARPMALAKQLNLTMTVGPGVPVEVIGDEKRLLQITLNILGNAVKFTKQGSVRLHVQVEDFTAPTNPRQPKFRPPPEPGSTYIRIEVTDTGLGIKASDIGKLFNKFVQADSTTTRNYGGTGLGLAICKKFVGLMGGVIWIESDGLDTGTKVCFIIKLGTVAPEEVPKEVPESREERNVDRAKLGGLRILVVDDNGVNRLVTRKLLDRLGCQTVVVESGAKCLATLDSGEQFAVLLLDLSMPEMDGYEVCQRIHARYGPGQHPLIVALTANTDKQTRVRCMKLDMDGIILKPVALDEMASVLSELVQRQSGASPGASSGLQSPGNGRGEYFETNRYSNGLMGTNMEPTFLPGVTSSDH